MAVTRNIFKTRRKLRLAIVSTLLFAFTLSHAGCFLDEKLDRYYGRIVVPQSQQFQWSDGGLPQTFDPAFAAAPPDTDLVRAIFEGLTDYDPKTLTPVPAAATTGRRRTAAAFGLFICAMMRAGQMASR